MARVMRRLLCMVIAALILMSAAVPSALAGMNAYISTATKVYAKPSTSSASLNVPKGMKVSIDAINGSWALVDNNGVKAFMPMKYLTLAERIKGYLSADTCLYLEASTSSTRSPVFPVNMEVYIIGIDGGFFRIQNAEGSITAYVPSACVSPVKVAVQEPEAAPQQPVPNVVKLDWYDGGSSVVKRGGYATIFDIESGLFINIKRMGGSNHADIEPATAEDTAKLLYACGGEFSWDSRPVILISGSTYVACAINTLPHGDQTIFDNNYEGQCCLHMVNSRTHGSDKINVEHQKAIEIAYNWGK